MQRQKKKKNINSVAIWGHFENSDSSVQKSLGILEQYWKIKFNVRNYKANNLDEILKMIYYFLNFCLSYALCYSASYLQRCNQKQYKCNNTCIFKHILITVNIRRRLRQETEDSFCKEEKAQNSIQVNANIIIFI